MSTLTKTPHSLATIRFQDCDPFNHLNNGRYVDYFLNAREDHLIEHYGLDIYALANETGRTWVVSTNQMAYLRPVMLMERVSISSQLIAFGSKDVTVELCMWDEKRAKLRAFCWMRFVHFDLRAQRSVSHSSEHLGLFEEVCLPVEQASFEERLRALSPLAA